jgi:hypothetical protein
MRMKGIVQSAGLEENPPGSDAIEMILKVQGVGAGQPRKVVIPFDLLLQDLSLDPDAVEGHAFEAEVEQAPDARWLVTQIQFAEKRILREKDR